MLFVAGRKRDDELRKPRDFVPLLFNRDAGLEVLVLDRAARFRQDRERVRVPFGKYFADFHWLVLFDLEPRAVDDVVALLFAPFFVGDGDQAVAVHGAQVLAAAANDVHVNEADEAGVALFEIRLFGNACRRSADVERAHGELRARLADRLRGDDADRFAQLDQAARCKVASVAAGAGAAPRFASQHRANLDALNTGGLNGIRQFLADFLVDVDDDVAFVVPDLVERNAAHDAIAQRFDFDARFGNRFDVNAVGGAAIEFADDDVLGDVDETASQV